MIMRWCSGHTFNVRDAQLGDPELYRRQIGAQHMRVFEFGAGEVRLSPIGQFRFRAERIRRDHVRIGVAIAAEHFRGVEIRLVLWCRPSL